MVWTLLQLSAPVSKILLAERPVRVEVPETVSWVIVVVARVEVALTVSPAVVEKVNSEEVAMGLLSLPNKMSPAVKALAPVPPLATESRPVKPGMKVRVLAVVVEMLMVMLVSLPVATWTAGPVRAEMEVRAEVR